MEILKEISGDKLVIMVTHNPEIALDYSSRIIRLVDGNVTDIDMPEPSNVLQYFTESGHKVSVRPSGTEPKIKFYMEAKGKMGCRNCFADACAKADETIKAMKEAMGI